MKTHLANSFALAAGLGLLVIASAGGCATVKQEFHGHDPGQVWTAMQAVARNPEYRDWHIIENHVHVDGTEARIHVYRILERTYVRPGARSWDEQVDWRFHIVLEDIDPPTARFLTRGVVIPTRAQNEGRRYFAEVRRLLMAEDPWLEPRREAPPRPPEPAPVPQPQPEQPADPVEDLGDLLEP